MIKEAESYLKGNSKKDEPKPKNNSKPVAPK